MGMMLNLLKKMDPEELFKIKTKANEIIANMDIKRYTKCLNSI
jgi:deoxyribodipyrimidine photolyase-related protein